MFLFHSAVISPSYLPVTVIVCLLLSLNLPSVSSDVLLFIGSS